MSHEKGRRRKRRRRSGGDECKPERLPVDLHGQDHVGDDLRAPALADPLPVPSDPQHTLRVRPINNSPLGLGVRVRLMAQISLSPFSVASST